MRKFATKLCLRQLFRVPIGKFYTWLIHLYTTDGCDGFDKLEIYTRCGWVVGPVTKLEMKHLLLVWDFVKYQHPIVFAILWK